MVTISIKLSNENLIRTEYAFSKMYPNMTLEEALKTLMTLTVNNVEESEAYVQVEEQIKANKKDKITFD